MDGSIGVQPCRCSNSNRTSWTGGAGPRQRKKKTCGDACICKADVGASTSSFSVLVVLHDAMASMLSQEEEEELCDRSAGGERE